MPKFHVEVTYELSAEVEPDGYLAGIGEADVEEFEENSSFYGESVQCSGGTISFVVEAEDEDSAVEEAERLFDLNASFESYNGFDWEISNRDVTVLSRVEEPMTLEKAIETLQALVSKLAHQGLATEVEQEAVLFLVRMIRDKLAAADLAGV